MIFGRVLLLAFVGFWLATQAQAQASARRLLVLEFEIVDTSNEPVDQRADHAHRLELIHDQIATRLAERRLYEIVDRSKIEGELQGILARQYLRSCNGCELTLGQHAGADLVMTGVVDKVSTLIMSMKVWIKNVRTGELLYFQTFDFRGDTDQSWNRAAQYFADRLAKNPPG